MSLSFISLDVNSELDSQASYVFTDVEELMWYKMYFIAARAPKREGHLEAFEGKPYTASEIALKIYREQKHNFDELVVVIQSTIDKAIKNDMMGISKSGAYYFKRWEQLSKEQRKRTHKLMQAGQCVENGNIDVKPIIINSDEKDKKITMRYSNKYPDFSREALSKMRGDKIETRDGDNYTPYVGKKSIQEE